MSPYSNYKLVKKLFRRYTRNASKQNDPECLFADDGALLASTRAVVSIKQQVTSLV